MNIPPSQSKTNRTPLVSNFDSIGTGFSRFYLRSTDICKAGVATLAPNILHITIRIYDAI